MKIFRLATKKKQNVHDTLQWQMPTDTNKANSTSNLIIHCLKWQSS